MKINSTVAVVEGNAVFSQVTKMTFDTNSLPFMIHSLTNMYSDPYMAILREYLSNAYDSHILAGQTCPIEVETPNHLNPNLIIRDFGVGMSRDELGEIYSKYGASTKRETNDQIGAFGLGAKSALALVAQFTVVSVQDGKKNTVIISKDATGVGALNFLDEQDTDEGNGVTITIPIPDSNRLNEAVKSVRMFLGWPANTVKVDGEVIVNTVHNSDLYVKLGEDGWLLKEPTGYSPYHSRELKFNAVIGPVAYTIKGTDLGKAITKELREFYDKTCQLVVMNIPNGSVDMTPNREELVFNENSRQAIVASLEIMRERIIAHLQDTLQASSTIEEAFEASLVIRKQGFGGVDFMWNGQEIPTKIYFGKTADDLLSMTTTHIIDGRAEHRRLEKSKHTQSIPTFAELSPYNNTFNFPSSDVILVVNASAPSKEKAPHNLVSNYVAYFTAEDTRTGNLQTVFSNNKNENKKKCAQRTIYTVNGTVDSLNPWFVARVTKVIDASEILEFARNARKEREAARLAAGVGETKKVMPKENVSISVAVKKSSHHSWRGTVNTYSNKIVNSSELPEDTKFLLIPELVTSTKATEFNIERIKSAIYTSLRSKDSFRADNANGIIGLILDAGYTLVTLPANRNLEKTKAALGDVVSFEEAFEGIVTKAVDSLTADDKEWITLFQKNEELAWVSKFEATEDINLILDEGTRNWISIVNEKRHLYTSLISASLNKISAIGYKDDKESALKNHLAKLTTVYGETIASNLLKVAELAFAKPVHNYPLLRSVHYSLGATEIAEYINLKDSARKGA